MGGARAPHSLRRGAALRRPQPGAYPIQNLLVVPDKPLQHVGRDVDLPKGA